MRTLSLIGLLGLLVALTACNKDEAADTAEAPAAEKAAENAPAEGAEKAVEKATAEKAAEKPAAHPIWPGVDLAAELKRLEGRWLVKTAFGRGEPDTWEISGDKVTITKADGKTELGKLSFEMPGRIGVKVGDMTSFYAYARDGDTTWIGLGTGGAKAGDAIYVAASRGLVKFDGKACGYLDKKMSFGEAVEFKDPVEVKCEVQAGGDKAVFNYQVPRFMKEGEFDDKSVQIVGEALLNDQLMGGHEVKPATPAPTAEAAEGAAQPAEGAAEGAEKPAGE